LTLDLPEPKAKILFKNIPKNIAVADSVTHLSKVVLILPDILYFPVSPAVKCVNVTEY